MIMHYWFIETAKKHGKKIAIVDRTTGQTVSYSKALVSALTLAGKFKQLDQGYIGVMLPTSAGAFLVNLGLLMSGRIPVMINYSTGAAENYRYVQNKIGLTSVITSGALLKKINCPLLPGMIQLEDVLSNIGRTDKLKAFFRALPPARMIIRGLKTIKEDDDVVILFTSGSEKEPKAVQLTHHNLSTNVEDTIKVLKLGHNDVVLSMLPLFHSFGHMANFWMPLVIGMKTVTYANPLDYKAIPKICREERVTMMASTPVFFGGYLKESEPGDFETLRIMVAGADQCHEWLRKGYREKHNKELLEGYGVTETSPVISANTPEANKSGSIGRPWPRIQVKIRDIDTDQELPVNREGKITVKGDYVMKGYYEDVEETVLRIRNGWYDTGDMGLIDEDGFLWHRGRLKRFVKIGGEMVSLVKVEAVLESLLPEGVSCCVVEIHDPRKGARLAAAVTREVDSAKLIRQMKEKLSPIETPCRFLVFDELPKMGNGKTDFRKIGEMVKKHLQQ